jgi:hypothetical protein
MTCVEVMDTLGLNLFTILVDVLVFWVDIFEKRWVSI